MTIYFGWTAASTSAESCKKDVKIVNNKNDNNNNINNNNNKNVPSLLDIEQEVDPRVSDTG